jgi:hypothetical protein
MCYSCVACFYCGIFLMCLYTFLFFCFYDVHGVSYCPIYVSHVQYMVCPMFKIWFEYPKFLLLFLIACACSLYVACNVHPVCPTYISGQIYLVNATFSTFICLGLGKKDRKSYAERIQCNRMLKYNISGHVSK